MFDPESRYRLATQHQSELRHRAADDRLARRMIGSAEAGPMRFPRLRAARRAAVALVFTVAMSAAGIGISQAANHHAQPTAPAVGGGAGVNRALAE